MITLDDKWDCVSGRILLNGTQAIARVLLAQAWLDERAGLKTAGYVSGYRGSPLGNVDNTLWSIGSRLEASHIHFQPGVNEDLAATAVAGSQQIDQVPGARFDGVFAAWYGKGPGVDRSLDAFRHGNYAGAHAKGGVVLFYGDDHAGKSSTVAFQSEQAVSACMVPVFYPANVGEIVEYGLHAYALSRHSGSWVAIKCVNEVVEQTATIDIDLPDFAPVLPAITTVPPEGLHAAVRPFNPLRAEQIVIENRFPAIIPYVRANRIDRAIFRAEQPRVAIATAGKSYGDVRQALDLLGLDEQEAASLGLSLYKVGCIWPLDGESLADFARGHETLFVIEEKKSFIELQVATALVNDRAAPQLIGKKDIDGNPLLSSTLQLEPADLARIIARLLGIEERAPLSVDRVSTNSDASRTPYFCSGCPHSRSTRIPEGSLSMTGIGCHTMANFVRPDVAMLPTQMGGEGANWLGLAPFTDMPHIFQNMGDGTYYHSGLLAIRAAVAANVNITYKILYNDAVAMTGGQPVDGPISVFEIAQQVRHEGVGEIVLLSDNPGQYGKGEGLPAGVTIGHRDELDTVQRHLREMSGCSVLIYEQTCAAEKRRRRKRGTMVDSVKRLFIAEEVCEGCGDCSVQSTCVSIVPKDTPLGTKRAIDQSSCNKDYSCANGFCPSFITVKGAGLRKAKTTTFDDSLFADLPEPIVLGGSINMMVAGIGGTGVITVGAILSMAAHIDGLAASAFDMTGLAQKNGAVFSHLRFAASVGDLHSQKLGEGEADLMLAFDLVAALSADAVRSLGNGRTRVIANTEVVPTSAFQFNRDFRLEPEVLLARLRKAVGSDAIHILDAAGMATRLMGDSVAANMIVVGHAAQAGLLPVSVAAIEQAITLNRVAVPLNLRAFRLGRLSAFAPDRIAVSAAPPVPLPETLDEIVAFRTRHLTDYQDAALAEQYRAVVAGIAGAETAVVPGSERLARIVARNLGSLLAIKDEYEVARLLTLPALHERLKTRFADGAKLSFNLAPPMLGGTGPDGRPRKREFPAWAVLPLFRVLKGLKGLRGTMVDPFGHSGERKAERALASDYAALVDRIATRLSPATIDAAAIALDLVSGVRGFGPVKMAAMADYGPRLAAAEAVFDGEIVASHDQGVLA
ncbi:MAG: indolepyruvate ferredoxin oxidoreductase [Sphingomonadales bacterium]|nr:indolepyruvate ferredoxin oxidoreductase [Sphingomonadales bacterium]